jgi:hypothetical protein
MCSCLRLTKCASAAGAHPPAIQHLPYLGSTRHPVPAEDARPLQARVRQPRARL